MLIIFMKSVSYFILPLVVIGISIGCEIAPDHSIRIRNNYAKAIDSVKIGTVYYGYIPSGEKTRYKSVEEGSHHFTGKIASEDDLNGMVSVRGPGVNKWTLRILSSGDFDLRKD
jgi:hypothetical protein